jgi:acyl carrier protein
MRDASSSAALARISEIIHDLMRRRQLPPPTSIDQSLREVGLKSLDFVTIMMAIEDEFAIDIPQHELTLDNFQSIETIGRLVSGISPA